MDFFLFLLVNATLFIRPGELIPATEGWPIYNFIIVINLLIAGPAIINHLTQHGLSRCPTTFCVLGVFAFIVISHLARFDLWSARYGGFEFAKVVAYFLLLVATVNTPGRLFVFIAAIVTFTIALNLLAVLQYHGVINLPALEVVMETDFDELTGQSFQTPRMRATGIFNDPNDLSMIIVAATILSLSALLYAPLGVARLALVAPIGFLIYSLTLTQSRGGLLALLTGGAVLAYGWFGIFRGALLAAIAAPVALVAVGGRQAGLGSAISEGSGRGRAEFWSAGLQMFKQSPVFGVGYKYYEEYAGGAAHNSFVHAFGELGFFGGTMFLGVFAVVAWSLWKLHAVRHEIEHPALRHLAPYILALLGAISISMFSLSRNYVVPTYLYAGIAVAYLHLAQPGTSVRPIEFSPRVASTLAAASVACLAFVYLYIKVLYRMG